MNVIWILVMAAAAVVVLGALYLVILQIGLQEADDPAETEPDDLTEFEKKHVDRADVADVHDDVA